MNNEIIILSGIPCSGKSSFAKNYRYAHCYYIISRDDIRASFFMTPYVHTHENEKEVTRVFDKHLDLSIGCKLNIIIDNTNCKEKYINELIKKCPKGYTVRVMFFDCSLIKSYIRNIRRYLKTGKWIPFRVIRDMKRNYDKIDKTKYA